MGWSNVEEGKNFDAISAIIEWVNPLPVVDTPG